MVDASERLALGVLALGAVVAIATVARPVAVGILLGTLAAFALEPVYDALLRRTKRPKVSALLCVGLALVSCVVILGGIGSLLIARGSVLVSALISELEPGGELRRTAERWIQDFGLETQTQAVVEKLRSAATDIASRVAGIAALVATGSYTVLLMLFFLLLALYFVLNQGRKLEQAVVIALPLEPSHSRAMLDELHNVGRTALVGTVVTGVVQGLLAGVGFWVCGVPEAAFFGALTSLASLIPGVGTLLVWVPAGVYLILAGNSLAGVIELVWGAALVVGLSDYVLRPILVGGHGDMPPLFTFAALFGGVEAFGLVGLIVGPLLMSLAVALLRIYVREMRARKQAPVA
jgi:predicted PurR-regulated permease PerM